ncbi:hypothetical protein U1Q18_026940 [Sarracenia purpurea var. burkii]
MEAAECFIGCYFAATGNNHYSPENRYCDQKPADNNHFAIDDLLDFSKEDEVMIDAYFSNVTGNSADSSTVITIDNCNSMFSGDEPQFLRSPGCRTLTDSQFPGDLCVPCDDLAELEWLSNFVEDSFSKSDDLQNLRLNSATKVPANSSSSETVPESRSQTSTDRQNTVIFRSDVAVPGKARSKRSRAAPCDWSSRILALFPAASSSEPHDATKKVPKMTPSQRRDTAATPGRKCLHCGSEKTPQWRTGPLGPKTLCNACGVRNKSGRLVPEYRPAASPTFVSTRHSNSHRKVLELRRQKELQRQQEFLSQSPIFEGSYGHGYI